MSATTETDVIPENICALLLQVALIAIEIKQFDMACKLAEALYELSPNSGYALSVLAMIEYRAGQEKKAFARLQKELVCRPDNHLGHVLLGVFEQYYGRAGWQARIEDVINHTSDPQVLEMASLALDRPSIAPSVNEPNDPGIRSTPANALWG